MEVTVVLPTHNERDNISEVCRRIADALTGVEFEIVVVDDCSTDGTREVVRELARDLPVRFVFRERRGLASAILFGMSLSRSPKVVVLDADMQHPPGVIPEMVRLLDRYDLVVGSRYVEGSEVRGISSVRRASSLIASILLRPIFGVKDIASGFFAVRLDRVNLREIRPRGFKVLPSLLLKNDLRVVEVPISFGPRTRGSSKLRPLDILAYAATVLHIYLVRSRDLLLRLRELLIGRAFGSVQERNVRRSTI